MASLDLESEFESPNSITPVVSRSGARFWPSGCPMTAINFSLNTPGTQEPKPLNGRMLTLLVASKQNAVLCSDPDSGKFSLLLPVSRSSVRADAMDSLPCRRS